MFGAKSLNIDINDICNLACEYCRVEHGNHQMDFSLFQSIIDRNPDRTEIGIGGGEPLLHPNLGDMVRYLLENERKVILSTNLWKGVDKLIPLYGTPAEKFTLQVSIPASNPALYYNITGTDAFDDVVKNLNDVCEGLSTLVSCVVYKKNLKDIGNMIELSTVEMELPIRINLGYPTGKAKGLEVVNHDELLYLAREISTGRVEHPGKVISGIRFTDSTCTDVIVPCNFHAKSFGVRYENAGVCNHDNKFYDSFGKMRKCEFMEAK
jgi:molybdenum cofactor biosynthesis enzyme MoaA